MEKHFDSITQDNDDILATFSTCVQTSAACIDAPCIGSPFPGDPIDVVRESE